LLATTRTYGKTDHCWKSEPLKQDYRFAEEPPQYTLRFDMAFGGTMCLTFSSKGTDMPDVINFYSVGEEYGCLSNFATYPIRLGGRSWPTSEHYFQAQKFEDKRQREAVRKVKSPMLAARMGRDRKSKLRRDWESVKVSVMTEAVRAKFTQHDELRAILLSTGDAKIVEHTENDDYWGDGGDGSGKNMLGQILMRIRSELQEAESRHS
jgi:ribA/ribD-fused uncharacterized protein